VRRRFSEAERSRKSSGAVLLPLTRAPRPPVLGWVPDFAPAAQALEDAEETCGFVILVYPSLVVQIPSGTLRDDCGNVLCCRRPGQRTGSERG